MGGVTLVSYIGPNIQQLHHPFDSLGSTGGPPSCDNDVTCNCGIQRPLATGYYDREGMDGPGCGWGECGRGYPPAPARGVGECCKLPHLGPTPYSTPAGEEINDICLFSTFRRLRACIQFH